VKTIVGILPWVVVVAAIGGAIWWLLSRDMSAGRWLLAALLIGHGVVHVMFAVPAPAATGGGPDWPFDMARSWARGGQKPRFDHAAAPWYSWMSPPSRSRRRMWRGSTGIGSPAVARGDARPRAR